MMAELPLGGRNDIMKANFQKKQSWIMFVCDAGHAVREEVEIFSFYSLEEINMHPTFTFPDLSYSEFPPT